MAQAASNVGAEIVTDTLVQRVDRTGAVFLDNGGVRKADLVVVASGFNSDFRNQLGLTTVARQLANGATRILVPRTCFEAEDMTREWWSGRRRFGIAPATAALTHAYMSCPQSDVVGVALPVDVNTWAQSFPMLAPMLDRLRHATGGTRHAYTYVHCHRWSDGSIALVGDAAHSMPPTLGQGAGCTLMNAYVLSEALSQSDDVQTALAAWERKIRRITDETQKWALRYDALMSNWPLWLSDARRGVIWAFGRSRWLNERMRIADRIDVRQKSLVCY